MDLIDRLIRASGGSFTPRHEDGVFVAEISLPVLD
jgi:hypothetical protein